MGDLLSAKISRRGVLRAALNVSVGLVASSLGLGVYGNRVEPGWLKMERITVPVVVTYGTLETPEFQRQAKDFAAALEAAGKPVLLLAGLHQLHQDTWETLGNPYGLNGRAALAMMRL